jgi:hypothetical protein
MISKTQNYLFSNFMNKNTRSPMQLLFEAARKFIAVFLVTVLLVSGTWVTTPEQARAGSVTVINCSQSYQPQCGNTESPLGDIVQGIGYLGGLAGDIAAISSMGAVSGLSGAGITSGLAALGGLIGGGMVAGLAVTVAAPAVIAVAAGTGVSYISQLLSGDEANAQSEP